LEPVEPFCRGPLLSVFSEEEEEEDEEEEAVEEGEVSLRPVESKY
jgi:hypothetical protein